MLITTTERKYLFMKRMIAMVLAVLLAFSMMPATVDAAENVTLKITADKSTVNPGDTVNFTVSIGAVTNLGGLEFDLVLPTGLTLNDDSVSLPQGLAETLDSDGEIGKPRKDWPKWSYSAQQKGYTGSAELTILTFSCTVEANMELGAKSIDVDRGTLTCFNNTDYGEFDKTVVPAALTVEKAKIPVTGVSLDRSSITLKDGETVTLTASVEPADADNRNVAWSSDDTAVASVADGVVTAVKAGTANITVTTQDGNETAACVVTVICGHTLNRVGAVSATCETAGNVEYYICTKCDKKFADSEGKQEITKVAVEATGHKADETWKSDEGNHWQICTVCSNKINQMPHAFEWVVDKAATEDATGIKHEECICGAKRSENTEIPKTDHVHKSVRHPAVAATCVETGNVEYWTCSSPKCEGKYYGDAECQKEIVDIIIEKDAKNHVKGGEWNVTVENHSMTCLCGTVIDEGPHVYDDDEDVYCNICNYERPAQTTDNTDTENQPATDEENEQGIISPKTGEGWNKGYVLIIVGLIAAGMLLSAGLYSKRKSER